MEEGRRLTGRAFVVGTSMLLPTAPIIVKVYLDAAAQHVTEVPITPHSTVADMLDCCRQPGELHVHLAELWRGIERPVSETERPYEILQQWGIHRDEVCFYLRHQPAMPTADTDERAGQVRQAGRNGMTVDNLHGNGRVPHGVDLTLSELQEMAARQQQQIEAQQQQLVAKEQRLRFLKQQELRHEQIAAENERLRKLREKVESQELKLKKLRALRGQVSEHKGNNNNLTAELEMIKSLFNEKEKELSMAVTKVEELTKQLEELRNGRINGLPPGDNRNNSPAFLELEKLRKELMVRNKLNEAQNSKLAAHREVMVQRKDEMSNMDVRIAELQQRLRKNRNLQQQQHQEQQQHNQQAGIGGQRGGSLNAKIGLNRPLSANIAAVEPYIKHGSTKDMVPDQQGYSISKQDPKYQTLPPNIKLLGLDGKRLDAEANGNGGQEQHMDNEHFEKNNNNQQYHQTSGQELKVDTNQGAGDAKQGLGSPGKDLLSKETVHKVPDYKPSKGHTTAFAVMEQVLKKSEKTDGGKSVPPRGGVYGPSVYKPPSSLSNFTARPFGSTYSTAMLANRPSIIGTQSTQSTPTLTNSVSSPGAVFPKTSTPIAAGSYSNQQDDMREIFITGAPSSSSSTSFSGRPPTYTPAPPGNAPHNYPPVTISTSNAMASPVSSSELSPKPGSMQYQIANSRPQQAMYPQRAGNLPAPQSSLQDQEMSKLSPTSLAAGSRGNTPVSSGNFPAITAAGEGRPNVPGQIGISLSTKVTLSERHALGSNGDSNTSLGNQGSASLNQGSNSPSSPTDVLQYPQPTSATDSKKDITPNSVSSALSVLMSGPTTTVATTRPYRYAPKSVIANTYMRKLGSNTLDEYRKTMNHIYKDFTPAAAPGTQAAGGEAPTGEPDMAAGPRSPPGGAQLRAASPTKLPESSSGADDHSPSHVPPYQRAANHEMEAERIRYKANAPKTLRRRLSAGESDELAHLAPKAQYPVVSDKADLSTSQTHAAPSQDNVVRVDTIQDSYNNNTGYSGDVKGVPYNAPHGDGETLAPGVGTPPAVESKPAVIRRKKTNLKTKGSTSSSRRVSFDPLALLLDASLEGELELVKRTATEVSDPSAANDEGITALHNAICAGHYDIVKFLTEFGCNVNAPDSDGWTPLHCAASCNNLAMVKLLVEHGACIFATTISDQETAAEKCEEDEDGYDGCSEYLYSIQEKLGIVNKGVVYAVFDYNAQNPDELSFRNGNNLTVLRKGDEQEKDWWWARSGDREGYIPRNLLGSFPRVPLQSAYESRGKER